MNITISICTRDRAASLRRALESIARLERNEDTCWDVLVVDNGSSDETGSTAKQFAELFPIRVLSEPQQGLSRARNLAISRALGEYLIFVDDDVAVPDGWLQTYASGFERYPHAAFFGGPIIARASRVSKRRLSAIKEVMAGALTWLEPLLEEVVLTNESGILPWGANMAFRLSAMQGFQFDVDLGRGSCSGISCGEEIALVKQLLASGFTGVWLPAAKLDHHVSAKRCSTAYFRHYCREVGRHDGYLEAVTGCKEAAQVMRWLAQTLSERQSQYENLELGGSLVHRLRAIRDLELIRGYQEGFSENQSQTGGAAE